LGDARERCSTPSWTALQDAFADGIEKTLEPLTQSRVGSGEPLLLLHGLGLSWRSWLPILGALKPHHDVIALDLPGFGDSAPLPEGLSPTPARLVDAVECELDRLGIDAAAVVGNSLGGWLALELAVRGRATCVVAIAPSGLESPPERAYVISLNEMMRVRARASAPFGRLLTSSAAARTLLFGGLRSRPWRLSSDEGARELREFGCCPGFQSTLASTVATRAPTHLHDIRVPVHIAFGTRDLMLGAFTAPRFAIAIPTADLIALPGLGHVPMLDDPDLVAETVLALSTRPAASGATPRTHEAD
jgi:pimeloyl-ACP methyl ester carboxylesterase